MAAAAVLGVASVAAETVYRETFPGHRDPSRHLRIAGAADQWQIIEDKDGSKFLRVTVKPLEGRRRAVVVWDLAPIQFSGLGIYVRAVGSGGEPVFLTLTAMDRAGTSYSFQPFGKSVKLPRKPLPADGAWGHYLATIPGDLDQVLAKGRQLAPFLHGRGEAVANPTTLDCSNVGFEGLHFQVELAPKSMLIDNSFEVDFKLLELTTR